MCLPSGWPKHPSRLESYFKQGCVESEGGGVVVRERGEKTQGWRGWDFFSMIIYNYYSRGQFIWHCSGGEMRPEVDGGVGGAGKDVLFTKGRDATGMLYISCVSCPDFLTYRRVEG